MWRRAAMVGASEVWIAEERDVSARTLVVALLVGAAALSALTPTVALPQEAAGPDLSATTLRENDCAFLIQFGDDPRPRLGEIACGTLEVPENWAQPAGRRLEIGYVILRSDSPAPAPDPVVYLEGGPGGSALTGVEARAEIFAGLRQERDVVLFDQRGTRLSTPLRCEALSVAPAFSQVGDDTPAAATPEAAPPFPAELGEPYEIMQTARHGQAALYADCAREIAASGVDLRQYNSISSAADTLALVAALGYEEFNLYGISYGTRLALVILREYPGAGVRSVVLDSTFPPEIAGFERYPEEPHEVVIQLFADCAIDPVCRDAYPQLKARFIALLGQLREEPVITTDGIAITDRDLIEVMQSLASRVEAVPYVPLMIAELERGRADVFLGIVSGSLFAAGSDETANAGTEEELAADAAVASSAATPPVPADLSPARAFLFALQARSEGLPEDDAHRLLGLLLHLDKLPAERETLVDFVARAFPDPRHADDRAALLALLAAMSDEDIQELFIVAEETVTLFDFLAFGTSPPQFNSVECNEEVPFQSFENTVAIAQGLEIPELALGVSEAMANQFAICEVWPSGRAPAIEALPVASDVPTLILAGSYDLQTPVSWNKSAFVTLPNGVFVEIPMSGHGTILYSSCAEGIAEAFIADPTALPDTSCVAAMRPAWALPSEDPSSETGTPVARAALAADAG